MIENAQWANIERTEIRAIKDGIACTIPADPANRDYAAILDDGVTIADISPAVPTVDDYTAAVQSCIDATARSRNYTDGVSLASYKDSSVAQWATEAAAFIAWRDKVWTFVYAEMAVVQGGQEEQPTIEGLLAGLPTIAWPQ